MTAVIRLASSANDPGPAATRPQPRRWTHCPEPTAQTDAAYAAGAAPRGLDWIDAVVTAALAIAAMSPLLARL